MSFFKKKTSAHQLDPFISVNCDLKAEISNRVELYTQNFEFAQDSNSDSIALLGRAYENGFGSSKKGMSFVFSRNIQSDTYTPGAAFPFQELYYFESGANDDFLTFYTYKPESGSVSVEVVANSSEQLSYILNFDFKGKDDRTETLRVVGEAKFNVFMRSR
jgi:hypothetical protein